MFKEWKKKIAISTLTLSILVPLIGPEVENVSASERDKVNAQESERFDIVGDTTLIDKNSGFMYEFATNEDMINHMNIPKDLTDSFANEIEILSSEWEIMDFDWLTKTEVQELAADVRRGQAIGDMMQVAGTWMYKVPLLGASVTTVGYFLSNNGNEIIAAANNNQSITIYRDQRVNWDGYSARTRTRLVRHN